MTTASLLRLSVPAVLLLAACGQDGATVGTSPSEEGASEQTAPLAELLDAIGGADALRDLQTVSMESTGRRFELDEHLRPGDVDPMPLAFTMTAYFDAQADKLRLDVTRARPAGQHQASLIIDGQLGVISGQDAQFAPPGAAAMTSDRWASVRKEQALLNPHVAFRDELLSGSVTDAGDELLGGANHHVLVIANSVAPIRLYVDAATGNLSKLSTMETEHLRRDSAIEVTYANWRPADGGLAFPTNVTMTFDGETIHEETRGSVTVNAPLGEELFAFPEGVSPAYDQTLADWGRSGHQVNQIMASIGFPRSGRDLNVETEELAPGVHHVRGGSHHSLVVEQANGLVVVEAPLHELRSEAVIDWIESTFPGEPITHVVATHHHTDHTAGLRTYAARGATVVVHEAARDFFADIFERPSTLRPDALAESPRAVTIETMPADGSYTIADDELPVSVYPLANEHAADMVLVYVGGAARVAFMSDIYSPNPGAPPGAGGQAVQAAIEAAGIDVEVLAGGHGGTIAYETFAAAL